jgi:ABC-type sugar transport system permease subunit
MTPVAIGLLAFIIWAIRRFYIAWSKGYVTEVDDEGFGGETARMSRSQRPKLFWSSVTITTLLLLTSVVLFYFVAVHILTAQSPR